jgi:RNA polymerase sigma-70 factor (ECF subfamily)
MPASMGETRDRKKVSQQSPQTLDIAMAAHQDSKTSFTLLQRLALVPMDQEAWGRFVDRYAPKIIKWCRAWGLQKADVEDVSQSVLMELASRLRRFQYDPGRSFRGFLKKVVRDALIDSHSARVLVGVGGTDHLGLLGNVQASDDLVRRLENEFDLELFDEAKRQVRQRVQPRTWEAFFLTTIEGRPSQEVAGLLEMRVGSVYQDKYAVTAMLQEEVRRLESST